MSFKIKTIEEEDNMDSNTAIKPIAEIYDIEEFRLKNFKWKRTVM